MTRPGRRWVIWLAGGAVWLAASVPARAVEQWQPFLDRLRQAGMFDLALAYLDQMATSPLCPPELKETLDYEAGVTLVTQSRTLRAPTERAAALDAAQTRLTAFLAAHPKHPMAAGAAIQLANVLIERGRMKADDAARPIRSPAERDPLLAEARSLYVKAQDEIAKTERHYVDVLKNMPKGPIDPKQDTLLKNRTQAQRDLLQARISLAAVVFEQAMLHPADSQERKNLLTDAAARFRKLYKQYDSSDIFVSPFARMNEGQCYKELGDFKQALDVFNEIFDQKGNVGPMRELKTRTLVLFLQTALEPKVKRFTEAIARYEAWKATAPAVESNPDALAAHYFAGQAYLEAVRGRKANDPRRNELLTAAHEALDFVGRFSGDHQREAKSRLLDPLFGKPVGPAAEPATFAEARNRGQIAFDRAQMADVQDRLERQRGEKKNHARYVKEMAQGRSEAETYYRMALALATPETPVEEVNTIRYHLAHLYLSEERFYDAAVLGAFLVDHYPKSPAARPGALVALIAYAQLYNAARPGPVKDFAHARMLAATDAITQRWPASSEAADAWITLIQMAILAGRLDTAQEYLAKVPADAPGRGPAELRVGRAMWDAYLRARKQNPLEPDQSPPRSTAEQESLLTQARSLLTNGLAKLSAEEPVDLAILASMLSLVQIHLRDGRAPEAVSLLENARFGPLILVKAKHPAAQGEQTAQEIHKAALRAYVATRQLEKAARAMDALEKTVPTGGDAAAAATLTRIYVALGMELQDQLELLRQEGKTREMADVASGFELFLDRAAHRDAGNTFNSLHWVAKTFAGMAAGFDAGGAAPSAEAQKYYAKAAETYQKILDRAKKEKDFMPADAAWGIEVGLATCLRRLGKHKEALDCLAGVLAQRNRMIDAQIQAAQTYQEWAATPGSEQCYLLAIQGGRPADQNGQRVNLVWGWGKIAKMVSRSPQYANLFHQARYNLARCRFDYAQTRSGAEKQSLLQQAQRDITVTAILYPEMGGPAWRERYDALLKKIKTLIDQAKET